MHYFIALEFAKEDRETFHALAKELKAGADKARIVQESHVHLTLSFLGELGKDAVKKAEHIVNTLEVPPFTLEFATVSYFEPRKGGRIFWIGPDDHAALNRLHTHLTKRLKDEGFALDERPFTPHVTLARGVRINSAQTGDFKAEAEAFKVPARSITLMASSFKQGTLIYTTITTTPLKEHSS